jgi:divalent metal cation (Fe/Co/Zn/Cd) transporter
LTSAIVYGSPQRQRMLRRAIHLEWLTLGWNLSEALIAIVAATAAASVALLGFGLDSLVESASACALLWRLRAEQAGREPRRAESRARRIVGGLLIALALFVVLDASASLWRPARPLPSALGLAVTSLSIVVMMWLARAKGRCADELGSRALAADAFQATACWWLSLAALAGVGLNALLGWWWADPIAALAMAGLIGREGVESWRGVESCC